MIAEGADAVCYKPFDVPELLGKLEQLAGGHQEEAGSPRARDHGHRARWISW